MKKRNIIFIIIFFLIILIILIFLYFKYLKDEKIEKIKLQNSDDITYNSNIIEDVYYSSKDVKGNEYTIKASQGEIDYKQKEIIYLTNVIALIKLTNSNDVEITSKYGKYNSNNLDTIFSKNVVIDYLENKITGEYLDSSIQRNSMIISRNVVYTNLENILKADVMEMNIDTKDTKIFMYKNKEKLILKVSNKMAVIKKFRIKSFKNINSVVEFDNISLAYGNRLILDNINFKINEGQIFGMLGPNGVGKSTIFNLITGLISPKSGKIKMEGKDVTQYPIYLRSKKFKVGYVPQYGGYFNDLTLLDNLKAISEIVIENKNFRDHKINYLISKFELDNLKDIQAKFLSGGQKKKLVIALSLLSDPKVLLLDECFAALDVLTIKMLQEIIVNLQQESNITICICDHQARDLLACVDVAMILSNGKIVAQDTPSNLVKNIDAKNAYFGDSFKIN